MPSTKKSDKVTITPVNVTEGTITRTAGFRISALLSFEDFSKEQEGKEWSQPLRARGNKETGKLAGEVVDGKWIQPDNYKTFDLLVDAEKNPLYVTEEGQLTTTPYIDGTRTPLENIVLEDREATPHRDFAASLTPVELKWPDGKVRKLRFSIKANAPMDAVQYKAAQEQKVQKMQASVLKKAQTVEDIDRMIADAEARKAELLRAKKATA